MIPEQTMAYRFRWALLVTGLVLMIPSVLWVTLGWSEWFGLDVMGLVGTPMAFITGLRNSVFSSQSNTGFYVMCDGALLLGIVLVAQWAFLRPGRGLTVSLTKTGRPMTSAVMAAALMAMFLSLALLATLLELFDGWDNAWADGQPWALWTGMVVVWMAWAMVFAKYWRDGDRYTQLSRMIRWLLAGSVLTLIIAAPAQAYATRNRDCYCARGSYTGLVLGGTVLFWLFGPGIVLLFLREKYRAQKLSTALCGQCGYDLKGSIRAGKSECPECGARVQSDAAHPARSV